MKGEPFTLSITTLGHENNIFAKLNSVALYDLKLNKINEPGGSVPVGTSMTGTGLAYKLPQLLENVKFDDTPNLEHRQTTQKQKKTVPPVVSTLWTWA